MGSVRGFSIFWRNVALENNSEKASTSKRLFSFLIPHYDELTLFAMSMTCLLLIIDKLISGWDALHIDFSDRSDKEGICLAIVFLSGLFLSLYHAFTKRKKNQLEKIFMLFFAVIINIVSGASAALYSLDYATGWKTIFPIINLVNSALLLALYRLRIIDAESIGDDNVALTKVFASLVIIIAIYLVSSRFFNHPWSITFSICVFYATNLNRMVQNFLLA